MTIAMHSTYLGLSLKNPLVASCSPITGRLDGLKRLEDAGVAAVVLPSMFEEQLKHEHEEMAAAQSFGMDAFGEAAHGYFPDLPELTSRKDEQLEHIRRARRALNIPVIASLNGHTNGGWVEYAQLIEEAGANALELNLYSVPADIRKSGQEVEDEYLNLVSSIRARTTLPLAIKLSPFFSSPGYTAHRLVEAGAQGLVVFNRFVGPDIDLETLEVKPGVQLSSAEEMRLPLRWIAILRGRVPASLAATTGVHSGEDIIKFLLAGADAVMATSAFLKNGPGYASVLLKETKSWLNTHEYESVRQIQGSLSQEYSPDPSSFERAHYMAALNRYAWSDA